MMKVTKKMVALTALVAAFSIGMQKSEACTRAVYIGPENMVVTRGGALHGGHPRLS